ncbi:UNVERIFIED_CONTAM: hypothetical protein GTU68_063876 [Idotea baltica]|nr:hypothetical protein [Idotea baltica]
MPRSFEVPSRYKSPEILAVKNARQLKDPRKKDKTPSVLDFGIVRFHLARHFGFCFGVENAIEIAYRVIRENPDKRVFLLSEMIHNPHVNADLLSRGITFLMKPDGTRLVDFSTLNPEDIVIVPAFGTSLEIQKELASHGIDPYAHDGTCPFVEKVWKRAADLGTKGFSIVLHGKRLHEETRATFSHSAEITPTLIVKDIKEAQSACDFILGKIDRAQFLDIFAKNISNSYDPEIALRKLGVVNQTTMLASDTHEIAELFKETLKEKYGDEELAKHFADTRDTLCYATYENQTATEILTNQKLDLLVVVGGFNSSNTSHLAELGELKLPTYYVQDADNIVSTTEITHWNLETSKIVVSNNWLPQVQGRALEIGVTAGASCPDMSVDRIIRKLSSLCNAKKTLEEVVKNA